MYLWMELCAQAGSQLVEAAATLGQNAIVITLQSLRQAESREALAWGVGKLQQDEMQQDELSVTMHDGYCLIE